MAIGILDTAGSFLLDEEDFAEAHQWYEAACAAFPKSARLLGGLGYSSAKLDRRAEAVAIHRRVLALAPDTPELLSDLGWALAENGQFDEAEQVLQQAVALAPPEYDRPRSSLEEVVRRRSPAVRPP